MRLFFDTSALVKAYIREPGSGEVLRALRRADPIVSRITHAELTCTIARTCRDGGISEDERDEAWDRMEDDFSTFEILEVRQAVLQRVRELAARHPLRGYDAVQLATALVTRQARTAIVFWSTDWALLTAARAEGLRVHQPTD